MVNIYQAITEIMSEGYAITKGKRNQKQGYVYRGIDDVMNTFQPLLAKHHVFVVPEVLEREAAGAGDVQGRQAVRHTLVLHSHYALHVLCRGRLVW